MTLKVKIFGILGVIMLLAWGSIGIAVAKLIAQGPELASTAELVDTVSDQTIPLVLVIKEIKADVLQVQGWLTDISATRGLPGFDDGFGVAEEFALKFEEDVALAHKLALELNLPVVNEALNGLEAAFPPFYEGGRKMAQAYIDSGPELGNLQMNEFDAVAETMGNAMDTLIGLINERSSTSLDRLHDLTTNVKNSNRSLISLLVAISVISAVIMLAGVLYLFKTLSNNFRDLSDDVAAVMSGEDDTPLKLGTDRRDEFAPIAAALAAFRTNIREGREREAELREKELREIERKREAERAAAKAEAERVAQREAESQAVREREQLAAKEISAVVSACASGDFSQRLETSKFEGVFAEICDGINRIGEVTNHGLGEIQIALKALSQGDLTHRMAGEYSGVFREISEVTNATTESLAASISQIEQSSNLINASTGEVADAASSLAQRTERSAATLEETSEAIQTLSTHVSNSAELANNANVAATGIQQKADEGNKIVDATVAAMNEIRTSTAAIGKTITLIDDITFQTNLLALNAGVEAARAGEAGRGFAVVASEVRDLATRSSDAAREISAMISTSEEQVDKGVMMVDQTGTALKSIAAEITGIAGQIAEISSSTSQQANSISEINLATKQLDNTTQENAAMFEQTTATSMSLKAETDNLARVISAFNVGNAGDNIGNAGGHEAQNPPPAAADNPADNPDDKPAAPSQQAVVQQRPTSNLAPDPEPEIDEGWDDF